MNDVLLAVTPTTIVSAALAGIIIGTIWAPAFDRALGVKERKAWAAFWGVELPGLVWLTSMATARWLDGGIWQVWVGVVALWTIMAISASITRLAGE